MAVKLSSRLLLQPLFRRSLSRTFSTSSDKVKPDYPEWKLPSEFTPLAQITDYVDKKICFVHPEAAWKMRFSSDYSKVKQLNRDTSSSEVYSYWPESCVPEINHDVITFLSNEFRKSDLARDRLESSLLNWAAGVTRVFSVFPDISPEQLILAHRHSLTTLSIDDVFEKISLSGSVSTFGAAVMSNLSMIVQEAHPSFLVDLKGFASQDVDKGLITAALMNQEAMKRNLDHAKRVLTPIRMEYYKSVCNILFEYLLRESLLLGKAKAQGNGGTGEAVDHFGDLLETRIVTVGFEMVLPGILPADDAVTSRIIQPFNPFVHMGSIVVAIDNDSVSAPKERSIMDGEESPFSDFYAIKNKGQKTDMETVRELLEKRNRIVRCMETQLMAMPKSWRPAYQNILKYTLIFTDYEYIIEHGRPNTRYGFSWEKAD